MQSPCSDYTITIDVGMKNLAMILFKHKRASESLDDVSVLKAGVFDVSAGTI